MATFPALEPATRSYDFGLFPLTDEPTASAGTDFKVLWSTNGIFEWTVA